MRSPVVLTIFFLFAISVLSLATTPDGINCKGTYACASKYANDDFISYLKSEPIPPNRNYTAGELIMCLPNYEVAICAFFEDIEDPVSGAVALSLLDQIYEFGCRRCGSIPVLYPESNAVNFGSLRINGFDNPQCKGADIARRSAWVCG